MLHFNDLKFYSIPPLPQDWVAPEWLGTELGLFAGRLYFEWSDHEAVCQLLGIDLSLPTGGEVDDEHTLTGMDGTSDIPEVNGGEGDGDAHISTCDPADADVKTGCKLFTSKPLQFLQEWLAVRRRGQDFVSTPMGFITQGKLLDENHPFFRKIDLEKPTQLQAPVKRRAAIGGGDEDDEDGADDMMCASYDDTDSGESDEIEYDEDEMYFSGEEETPPAQPSKREKKGKRSNS